MPSFTWTTVFTTPATPTGLVITADESIGSLALDWADSAHAHHEEFIVERREHGDWVEVGRPVTSGVTDVDAPLNTDVDYRIRDSIGAAAGTFLSEPLEASARLELPRWWMVEPGLDPEFTRELRYVELDTTREMPLDQVVLDPLSGPDGDVQEAIVITGQLRSVRLALSIRLSPAERDLIEALRRASVRRTIPYLILKDPLGPVYHAKLGGLSESRLGAGHVRIRLPATQVR